MIKILQHLQTWWLVIDGIRLIFLFLNPMNLWQQLRTKQVMKKVGNGDYAHPMRNCVIHPIDHGFFFLLGFKVQDVGFLLFQMCSHQLQTMFTLGCQQVPNYEPIIMSVYKYNGHPKMWNPNLPNPWGLELPMSSSIFEQEEVSLRVFFLSCSVGELFQDKKNSPTNYQEK